MTALQRHEKAMSELLKEIDKATGYRKKDLIRQFNRMEKERKEYLFHRKKWSPIDD